MSRVKLIDAQSTPGESKPVLDDVTATFGMTPAMFRAVANSPAALRMMWAGFGALGGGRLGARLGEQIAVLVADRNGCEYCLAAHTALGRKAGVPADDMSRAQAGHSHDPRVAAALGFAAKLVENRAQVTDSDVEALRTAGFDDEEIVELVAHVALNLFTNYVNVALEVPLDFPKVALREAG
ncbi:carboxymuconolactone decarboxylase family protein [Streptosporangium sp. NPDC048865]|uniref:carboxymuconolactone decarboxylase family protein n=1 Tax=Streptosporangium sp. NPDC048865 TaxID=3155766 RepID=UPI003427A4DB